jgi:hypothetical protein
MINKVFINRIAAVTAALLFVVACDSNKKSSSKYDNVARQWNEMLLASISRDFARPTVHARNLFHVSAATYDAWAAYANKEKPFLLGQSVGDFFCPFDGLPAVYPRQVSEVQLNAKRAEAISFAVYRLIEHRFRFSPGNFEIRQMSRDLMIELGYDHTFTSTDYSKGSAAALGNYIAECYINFGLQDGSNEANGYVSLHYTPLNNLPVKPEEPGNPDIIDLNYWQPISLTNAVDQAGNPVANQPPHLSPEWGRVQPFALQKKDRTTFSRGGNKYYVYHDPGKPPQLQDTLTPEAYLPDIYKWAFALVSIWQSHHDETDETLMDISPATLGNIKFSDYPRDFEDYPAFYDLYGGGVTKNRGHKLNPVTGKPYQSQFVKRADYARALAEYWADGPQSVTPPGHWFDIFNHINDHPMLERRFAGEGPELNKLEWDVKGYFTLGGALHDVAITAWGIKGWYDYVRPVSAIRGMAERGQSSNDSLDNYDPNGLPIYPGYIEVVEGGDPLAAGEFAEDEHVGKIKLFTWQGPLSAEANTETDVAGVGWILAENWWPYQRPTFVTPPFAGYISGHSTYSRAAAEVLTLLTGTPFFPGGMSDFKVKKNQYLVFERGPSETLSFQWATYQDASDQCSLSRIWGGIHPPIDDIPGRFIGYQVGHDAFAKALTYFNPN